ncbi:hypothetical protein N656DRAFT_773439 [Canariomyces notabilis]|uniref:Uncharacterized protein n=1 Tax=Canariomyces notabilis TaxID=2074819 RepID=A0AAN6TN81_9PEZI|nr:hypothetical protein N656DRAFT_773439 [Canariomyces arenarius]
MTLFLKPVMGFCGWSGTKSGGWVHGVESFGGGWEHPSPDHHLDVTSHWKILSNKSRLAGPSQFLSAFLLDLEYPDWNL